MHILPDVDSDWTIISLPNFDGDTWVINYAITGLVKMAQVRPRSEDANFPYYFKRMGKFVFGQTHWPNDPSDKSRSINYWGLWDEICKCIRGIYNNYDATYVGTWIIRKKHRQSIDEQNDIVVLKEIKAEYEISTKYLKDSSNMLNLPDYKHKAKAFIFAKHDSAMNKLQGFYFGENPNDYGEISSTIDKEHQIQIRLLSHLNNKKTIYRVQENLESIIFNSTIFPSANVTHQIISYTKSEKMEQDPLKMGNLNQNSIELFTNNDRFHHNDLSDAFLGKDTVVKIEHKYLDYNNSVNWYINYKGEITQTDNINYVMMDGWPDI